MPTFKEYAETFMNGYSRNNHKESTRENYKGIIKKHLLPVFGDKRLDKGNRADVKQFLFTKKSTKSVGNVKNLKNLLNAIFSEAMVDDIVPANPVARTIKYISSPEELEEDTVNPLTREEKTGWKILLRNTSRNTTCWFLLLSVMV